MCAVVSSGDALRWLGHCHQRLGDSGKAAAHFAEGCAAAQSSGNAKLEVDCLNGLGCLYRNENDSERAVSGRVPVQRPYRLAC